MEQIEFNKIFLSFNEKVFKYARSILYDSPEAEDVTQDIFAKLWLSNSKPSQFKDIESYLICSTKNICLDRIKHRKVVIRNHETLKRICTHSVEPVSEKKETSDIIKAIINKLPKKQKKIIQLRDIEGYDFDEINEATGMAPNAIRVNLSRARKSVKYELQKKMNYGL